MQPLSWTSNAALKTAALWRDRRAVSAVEFALILPLILLAYVGVVEVSNLLTVMRRVETVASTAADLTTQVKQVSDSDLSDIVAASTSILTPYPTGPLKLVLTSVVADGNNNTTVKWSYSSSGSGRVAGSSYTAPAGTTQANSSVIIAEVTYAFTPLLNLPQIFSPGSLTLQRTFYARPRRSLTVAKN
jgi:Flp pilus assembly protein TadG